MDSGAARSTRSTSPPMADVVLRKGRTEETAWRHGVRS
uniref:Uncharacterized protein n=1 Tax=Arundo donax TaxID=35708 RepID=A0A0A9DP14_ARUDO